MMSEVKITVSENGSLKIEGSVTLLDADGNALPTREGKPVYLCRCGHSANKPFCDSSHRRVGWDASSAEG
jgi:CDGSH-type Zn-finger protein